MNQAIVYNLSGKSYGYNISNSLSHMELPIPIKALLNDNKKGFTKIVCINI